MQPVGNGVSKPVQICVDPGGVDKHYKWPVDVIMHFLQEEFRGGKPCHTWVN